MSNLHPTDSVVKKATLQLRSLKNVETKAVESFSERLASSEAGVLEARASIIFVAFYGNLTVKVRTPPYEACIYDVDSWGLGGVGGESLGLMYTSYNDWDDFFRNVTAYHVQGIADDVGFLQVNWFISDGTPVGQFNAVMAGVGGVEAGGGGKWKC